MYVPFILLSVTVYSVIGNIKSQVITSYVAVRKLELLFLLTCSKVLQCHQIICRSISEE
jgi:hypothetical protein